MLSRTWCTPALLLAAIVAFSFFAGCSDTTEPEPEPQELVNPDKPNANSRIVSQMTLGNAGTWNTVWEVAAKDAGGYCFRGGYNDHSGVGFVNAAGGVPWFNQLIYGARSILALPQTAVVPNALLVIGAKDTDGDALSELGYVSCLSSTGDLSSQLVYSADTADVWFNGIGQVSDSVFVAAGGHRMPTQIFPFVASFVLTSAGELRKLSHAIVTGLPDRYFANMATDPSQAQGAEWSFFASTNTSSNERAVHRLKLALPSLAPSVEWSREIALVGAADLWVYSLCFSDGSLYLSGGVDDPAKGPGPKSGEYWTSGLAGSLTSAGELRWLTKVLITTRSDGLTQAVPAADGVYFAGQCSQYDVDGQYFGYGWLAKIAKDTGAVITHMTFGGDTYCSGFNDGLLEGNKIRCGGWTRQEVGGVLSGWICEVDIASP